MTVSTPIAPTTPPARLLPFLVGVGGGLLGILPWLVGGARLPLQNLWTVATMPDAMPIVLLPVNQYFAILLFSLVLLGGVFAGIAIRILSQRRTVAVWAAGLGVLAVHVIATLQSFVVVAGGLSLSYDVRALVYLGGMLGGAVAAALLAQLGFWMTSRPSAAIAALGIALAAVPFGQWVARWFLAFTGDAFPPVFLPSLTTWIPAIVVGVALAWCGIRPAWRIAVWIVSLLTLALLPSLFGAIQYGLGSRILGGNLVEMTAASVQIFPMLLAEDGFLPVLVALVIGIVGTVVRMLVPTRQETDAGQQPAAAEESPYVSGR
ncbi:hypothetical protein [Microbacterium sp. 3J1]|uniref:hypothetical protein n=1 Tax=Microbacterium sp. 3J1 TaxID=861269 RepID=UPI0011461506|nr:hypothetical protein [Microbacterium sp. 3J1]